MAENTATPVPQHSGARASREYAQRAALEHRQTVRRLIEGGTRRHADIAHALNEMAAPSPTGRPWDAGSVGRLLSRLGIKREAVAQRDAEALRDHVEELWGLGVRTRPQLAIALARRSLPCADGGT